MTYLCDADRLAGGGARRSSKGASSLLAAIVLAAGFTHSANASSAPEALRGIYQAIPDDAALPDGRRNVGQLSSVKGLPAPKDAATKFLVDPASVCQPIGPFRMMAEPGVKIEIVPKGDTVTLLFEDLSHGYWRTIYLNRGHRKDFEPSFQGDSIGRPVGDGLDIDTVGFNGYTWLNDQGARHSDALHLTERLRLINGGADLEYEVTADDPKALKSPFSYIRYYQRVSSSIQETRCTIAPRIPSITSEHNP